ncbi:hypothetical protein JVX93_07710 [Mycolicibacterium boenickei]|nr:hypothetical protein JVX93_07710 [Mycolicibacterium boenickei]
MRTVLKQMWGDLWILNTILFAAGTIILIGRVADGSWWWAAAATVALGMLVWQGVLGWRSSAREVEPSLCAEDSREAT